MKYLITGSDGFIGSNLRSRLLSEGHEVVNVNRATHGDIQDIHKFSELFEGIDAIFHLASTVNNYTFQQDPFLDTKVNVLGMITMLELYRNICPKASFNYVSTFFASGNGGMYGITKGCASETAKYYGRLYRLNVNILEVNNVFGLGEKTDSPTKCSLMRQLREIFDNKPEITVYDEETYRDYIYIDDAVEKLLHFSFFSGINHFVIGSGESELYSDLIRYAIARSGSKSRMIAVKPPHFHTCSSPRHSRRISAGGPAVISVRAGIDKLINYWEESESKFNPV